MSPLLGIWASSQQANIGAYVPIATTTVGAGGASNVEFTNIPSTYKHLQIRYISLTNRATFGTDNITLTVNGAGGTSYAWHNLRGDGGSASSGGTASTSNISMAFASGTTVTSAPGSGVIDFLDYANTNKNKTIRALYGTDLNGLVASNAGALQMVSGLYNSTTAISSIKFTPELGTFTQYTQFALYGVR